MYELPGDDAGRLFAVNEAQRQSCLQAMGLTPWVAHRPLPGAAPTPELEWPAEPEPDPAEQIQEQLEQPRRQSRETAVTAARPAPQPPASAASTGEGVRFALHAFQAGDLWLVFQLSAPDAPGPGREEARLLAALLQIWGARPGNPRRLLCPLTPSQPLDRGQAGEVLNGFLGELGGRRLLLCVDESLAALVGDLERYRAHEAHGCRVLAVSSPAEMLAAPAEHKRRSWQAMVRAGFHG